MMGRVCLSGSVVLIVLVAWGATADGSPLSPVISVNPSQLGFGCVPVGSCLAASVDVSNGTADPASILEITDVSVTGTSFALVAAPSLPLQIAGDGSIEVLAIEFCPKTKGPAIGSLLLTSSNAINAPLSVNLAGDTCGDPFEEGQFVVQFAPEVIGVNDRRSGPLSSISLSDRRLGRLMEQLGIVYLERLAPDFEPDDVNSTNRYGITA